MNTDESRETENRETTPNDEPEQAAKSRQILPDEVMPVDAGEREGDRYLLHEETAVDMMAVSAEADAITDRIDSQTENDDTIADFEARQARAQSGRKKLRDKLDAHHAESPALSGGDIDAAWDQSGVGDETVGGSAPTPDQDVVEELGEAVGLTYEDDEPLDIAGKMAERDENRWQLNPESAAENSANNRQDQS